RTAHPDVAALPLTQVETTKQQAAAQAEKLSMIGKGRRPVETQRQAGAAEPAEFFRQRLHDGYLSDPLQRLGMLAQHWQPAGDSAIQLHTIFRVPVGREKIEMIMGAHSGPGIE